MTRAALLRVAGFAIAVGGVVVALAWTGTCAAIVKSDCPSLGTAGSCAAAARVCTPDIPLRVGIATAAVAMAIVLGALAAREEASS